MRIRSPRWSFIASLALATTMATGAVAAAGEPSGDDPGATVNGLLDALVAKDFASIPDFVCEARKEATAQRYDVSLRFATLPPTVDAVAFIASLTVSTPDRTVTVTANDGTTATVATDGTLVVGVDDAAARVFVKQLLDAAGEDASDASVDRVMPAFLSQVTAGDDLTDEITVIHEGGVWLVCDEFGNDGASPDPSEPSPQPAALSAPMPSMDPAALVTLMEAIPTNLRGVCEPDSYWQVPDLGPDPGEIASVDCDPDGSGPQYLSYSLFDSAQTMDAFYDEQLLGMRGMGAVDGPGCFAGPGEGTWEHGRRFCYTFLDDANARWTDDQLLTIANATDDNGDWAGLEAFVASAGPLQP